MSKAQKANMSEGTIRTLSNGTQVLANSVDLTQMLQNAASDLDQHCLLSCQATGKK